MREIVYDTETTGKHPDRDKIVEIAAIELIDGVPTGRVFHKLVNPECEIGPEVVAVHGITNEKVKDAPVFKEIVPELVEFFRGARAIAHNSEFDEKFIDSELKAAEYKESFWGIVAETVDTVRLSRAIWRGKDENGLRYRHTLDAILDRLQIDRSHRTLHGALLDSQLLAEAYIKLKELKVKMGPTVEDDVPRPEIRRLALGEIKLPLVELPEDAPAPSSSRFARP